LTVSNCLSAASFAIMVSTSALVIGFAAAEPAAADEPADPADEVGAPEDPAAADVPGQFECPKIADAMLLKMPMDTSWLHLPPTKD
jgi:hypothetical protein